VTTATPPQRLARILDEAGAEVVVAGHTHRQFDRTAGGRRMINAADLVLAPVDPDAVAERYERARADPLPPESLNQPAANPLR
jgi:hypothetical protein